MSDFASMLRQAATGADTDSSATNIFDEEPVSLRIFVEDKRYLGNPPLSPVQYDALRHVERVYYPATYKLLAQEFDTGKKPGTFHAGVVSSWREEMYWSQPVRMCNFFTLQWGKGSGKDHVCRLASLRIAYLLLCLRSPQEYYGMPPQDTIHLLNVASSSGQAQQAFFMPIVRVVRDRGSAATPKWFCDKADARQNVISFAKNVEAISGHSDAESQEGLNLMLGIADEIDAFRSKKEMSFRRGASNREPTKSAEGILSMMRTSAATRFPEVYKNLRISYPRFLGSTIQRLTADAQKDVDKYGIDSRHFVSGPLATWDVNPRVKGKEDFAHDYREDPVMAKAKYECRPSRAINPYFRNHQAVDSSFREGLEPIVVTYEREVVNNRTVWVPRYTFSDDFFPIRGAIYSMHADMAVTGDRAGIAMAHVARYHEHETVAEDEDGARHPIFEMRPVVKVDFVMSFRSDITATPPREIQIRWARQLCNELIRRGFNVRRMTFDSFQSTDSMQILSAHGVESERASTDTSEDPWRTLKDLFSEGRITIPKPILAEGKSFLLRDELLSLSKLPNGRVDHPVDGSKDEADALALAVLGAIQLGGSEEADNARAHYTGAEFSTGRVFDMPFGISAKNLFETGLPSLPI